MKNKTFAALVVCSVLAAALMLGTFAMFEQSGYANNKLFVLMLLSAVLFGLTLGILSDSKPQ